jgi:hypothetical protein
MAQFEIIMLEQYRETFVYLFITTISMVIVIGVLHWTATAQHCHSPQEKSRVAQLILTSAGTALRGGEMRKSDNGGGGGLKEIFGGLFRGRGSSSGEVKERKKLQHVPSAPMLSPTMRSNRFDDGEGNSVAEVGTQNKQTNNLPVVKLSASTPKLGRSGSIGSRRVSGGAEIPFLDLTPLDKQRQQDVAMKIVPVPMSPQQQDEILPESPASSCNTQSTPTTGERSFRTHATSSSSSTTSSSSSSRRGWKRDSGLSSIGSSSTGFRLNGSGHNDLASDRSNMFSEEDDDDSVTLAVGDASEEYLVKVVAPQLKDVLVEEGDFIPLAKGKKKILSKRDGKKKKKSSSLKKISRDPSRPRLDMPPVVYELMPLTLDPKRPCPSIENTDEAVRVIGQKLKSGPMASDRQGFIYMYRSNVDGEKSMYRKIGRTENLPDRRVRQQGQDCVLIRSWKVKRDRFAEALIHWLLDRVRVYRAPVYRYYTDGRFKYLSRNKNTKQYVQDSVYCEYAEKGWLPKNFDAESKEIEWFYTGENVLMDVIQTCVTDINTHWKHEQWLHMFEGFPEEERNARDITNMVERMGAISLAPPKI